MCRTPFCCCKNGLTPQACKKLEAHPSHQWALRRGELQPESRFNPALAKSEREREQQLVGYAFPAAILQPRIGARVFERGEAARGHRSFFFHGSFLPHIQCCNTQPMLYATNGLMTFLSVTRTK